MIRAAVFGAAGYIGGELLRLLLGHPEVELTAAVSSRFPGKRLDSVHPNLRSSTDLTFTAPERADDCDVVFLATPHRSTMDLVRHRADRTDLLIDLSGDFRLRDTDLYQRYYGVPHEAPELLDRFVPGIPELHRDRLRTARLISVPGCMANAAILALHPLAARRLALSPVLLDGRTGSSGSGASAGDSNLHAERSGALRVFAPATHRHEAEVAQHTGLDARMTATGVEAVRGVQVVCHTEVRRASRSGTYGRRTARPTPTSRSSAWWPTSGAPTAIPSPRSCSAPTTATSAMYGTTGRVAWWSSPPSTTSSRAARATPCSASTYAWTGPNRTDCPFPGCTRCEDVHKREGRTDHGRAPVGRRQVRRQQ